MICYHINHAASCVVYFVLFVVYFACLLACCVCVLAYFVLLTLLCFALLCFALRCVAFALLITLGCLLWVACLLFKDAAILFQEKMY